MRVEVEILRAAFIAGQPVAAGARVELSAPEAQSMLDCGRAQLVPKAGVDARAVFDAAHAAAMSAVARPAWGGAALKRFADDEKENSRVPKDGVLVAIDGRRQPSAARGRTGRRSKNEIRYAPPTPWVTTPPPDEALECLLIEGVPRILLPRHEAEAAVAAGQAVMLPRTARKHAARCEWAEKALAALVPQLAHIGAFLPPGRVLTVAFKPMDGGLLAQCSATRWNWSAIGISSERAALDDPSALVHALTHEALHACDDLRSGHGGQWAWWAARLGINAHDCTTRSRMFSRIIERVLANVGELPALES